jgi:diguanylate cyclase (GGDEF)-like protein
MSSPTATQILAPGTLRAGDKQDATPTAPRPRLLIVDDISDNRAVLARRFQRRGFEITEADGGYRALQLINQESFDAVLLDVMMPDLDGVEVLKRIRQEHSPISLPVIMVTAKSQSDDVVQALECGANDYVTKPVDFAVALVRVNAQVGRKRAEEEIRQVNCALREANDSLERRVKERTAKLVEANEHLQREVQQRLQSEARTHFLAHHDALTGLGNRVLLREHLGDALARVRSFGESLAVLFIDLDGFKSVNDTLGHSMGDELLKCIARRLRDTLRETDNIARLGGDEFAILQLSDEQPKAATALARRLIEVIKEPCVIEGHQMVVGASIGIAVCTTQDRADPEQLLKNADLAMYRAKTDGRGTYRFFEPEMDARAQARRQLELNLREALACGDFELHYQPLVNLRTNTIAVFEALLRWKHPEYGSISPDEFIPVAEETGLIVQIGEWAVRQACAEAATWPEGAAVAVNLSPIQFRSGNLVATVINALSASQLPSHRLELEITESVLLDRTEANLQILRQLRALGVKISMDDFGTGYSSLSYLRSFDFDKIKIDRSFIRDISSHTECRAIVRAIAALGDSLGMTTVAEGVETAEQLRCLEAEGCTEIQGYLISAPVPARKVPSVLDTFEKGNLSDLGERSDRR